MCSSALTRDSPGVDSAGRCPKLPSRFAAWFLPAEAWPIEATRFVTAAWSASSRQGTGRGHAAPALLADYAGCASFPKIRSLSQCRSGNDEPVSARRSLCAERWLRETDLDLGHYERFTNCVALPAQQSYQRPGLRSASYRESDAAAIISARPCR